MATSLVSKVYQEAVTDVAIGASAISKVYQEALTSLDIGNPATTTVQKVWVEVITDPPRIIKRRIISVFMR